MQPVVELFQNARREVGKVVLAQDRNLELALCALIAEGHVLLEGPPGTAKTLMVRALARVLDVGFKRVQFTPDLMPADVLGTNVLDARTGSFRLQRGPIFTQLLLADEINRAPAKTQSALLQAMQEHEVTLDGETHSLEDPFMVCATQNPIEMEGTYPLPEAQLDRFMFKLIVDYPDAQAEAGILERHHATLRSSDLDRFGLAKIAGQTELRAVRAACREVGVRPEILTYVVALARATREHPQFTLGASSRGALLLLIAAKVLAAARGRDFVAPDEVKELALPALRHRVALHPGALVEGVTADEILEEILGATAVPR